VQQRLQILCDLAYTTGLPSTGIFTLRMACSAMRPSQAVLRSIGGQRGLRTLAFFCVPHVATAVIQARFYSEFAGILQGEIRQWMSGVRMLIPTIL
jgi:hypothetical protein